MKRILLVVAFVLVIAAAFIAWRVLGSGTAFSEDTYSLYIRTGMNYEELLALLKKDGVLNSPTTFDWVASRMELPSNVRAGKYDIKQGTSVLSIVRMLHNGKQTPVKIVITKFRTLEGLAGAIGKKLECDSETIAAFLHNNDSLKQFGVDSNTFMAIVMPNTYTYFWNTTPSGVLKKMYGSYKSWWTPSRVQQAETKGLNPVKATILASIVEEETNDQSDKGKIASVYLNRMAKGIKLGADPTIKYAMREFELKRVYDKYLKIESPYNTYLYQGLPPGPICTPSSATLDAVLQAPTTDYLYFVAKPDFSGASNFAATYKEHLEYAKAYREALDKQMAIRAAADSAKKK
ncbi:MAG: endolytic transglycosylase MltG [Bacteroidetes bacterium]|nr:endolytic transglycosylase MltG [Bacteroidota bacterium]